MQVSERPTGTIPRRPFSAVLVYTVVALLGMLAVVVGLLLLVYRLSVEYAFVDVVDRSGPAQPVSWWAAALVPAVPALGIWVAYRVLMRRRRR